METDSCLAVVVADDSAAVRRDLTTLLEMISGVRIVAEAADGATALGAVEATKPDLLILDVRMPNTDGLQVLKALEQMSGAPPVLILTNLIGDQMREHVLSAGAAGYYDKSAELPALLRDVTARAQQKVPQEPSVVTAAASAQAENRVLEQRVAERTKELAEAVRELEAFAYSVSHDLRTPLRALDGFSRALLEDYGDRLDDTGRDYLQRIRAGSQRMADLIDDMLRLSRVARADMHPAAVNLADIARSVAADLTNGPTGRAVRFSVPERIDARGDARLLRVALHNLLENAWKFTRHAAEPHVEMGVAEHEGETMFYIRDNGAGFDMTHAAKLFGAFQRLHRSDEFEGTGIGLVTVNRIIRRHGGRITAQASPGQGAAFHFTLSGGDRT